MLSFHRFHDVYFPWIVVLQIIVTFHLSNVFAILPEDLKPLSVYTSEENYSVFRGTIRKGDASKTDPMLQDLQGLKKIGRHCYIYARNYIFVLDLSLSFTNSEDIPYVQALEWMSKSDVIKLCTLKGQSAENCRNYIKVFEEEEPGENNKIIVCATNAFNPTCRKYAVSVNGSLSFTNANLPGSLLCPYDPHINVASLVSGKSLYTATKSGFTGQNDVIHRSSHMTKRFKNLRTSRGEITILNDPSFVRFVAGPAPLNKVFVFFTETAIEDDTYQIYSRVGQICKNDEGGSNLLRNQFTSFFKARLNCSLPGKPPFYFNELRDVTDLLTLNAWYGVGRTKMVFAIMNTPRNSIPASAICAFALDNIENSYNGPFKEKFTRETSGKMYWAVQDTYPQPHLTSCASDPRLLSDSDLNFVRKHPIMHNSVAAWSLEGNLTSNHESKPWFSRTTSRSFLTTIAADTEVGPSSIYAVILAGSEDGKMIKILLLKGGKKLLVEERMVFNEEKCGQSSRSVKRIVLDKETGSMLIAFQSCVIRAPLCPLFTECGRKCIQSRDPYCAWDGEKCVTADQRYGDKNKTSGLTQLRQDVINGNIDGMPECEQVLADKDSEDFVTAHPDLSNNSRPIGTGVGVVDVVTKPVPLVAPPHHLGYLLIGLGCLLLGIFIGFLICFVKRRYFRRGDSGEDGEKDEMEATFAKAERRNSHLTNRQTSTASSHGKSRPTSASSHHHNHSRHSNPRSSVHEEIKFRRHRRATESSLGNWSEDGALLTKREEMLEATSVRDAPETLTRVQQIQPLSCNTAGRRKHRSSRPSASSIAVESNDELFEDPKIRGRQTPPNIHVEPGYDDNAFIESPNGPTQAPNDNGPVFERFTAPSDGEPLATSQVKFLRTVPARSMSLQGHQSLPPIQRTLSIGQPGTSTIRPYRPQPRPINRKFSLQPTDLFPRNQTFLDQPQQFTYPTPHPPLSRTRMSTIQLSMPGGAHPNHGADNHRLTDLTHSLDRRRKPNGFGNFPVVFSEPFEGSSPTGLSNNGPAPRKRYLSESEAPPSVPVSQPTPYQAIHEEHEPLLDNQRHTASPQTSSCQPSAFFRSVTPTFSNEAREQEFLATRSDIPGARKPIARKFSGVMMSHNGPDTPQRNPSPNLAEMGYLTTGGQSRATLPGKKRPKPHPLTLPDPQQRLAVPGNPAHSSDPPSPVSNGRTPSSLDSERMRSGSGHVNPTQFPRSPARPTTAPVFFGSPHFSPKFPHVRTTRRPSCGMGRNVNGEVLNDFQVRHSPHTHGGMTPPDSLTTEFD